MGEKAQLNKNKDSMISSIEQITKEKTNMRTKKKTKIGQPLKGPNKENIHVSNAQVVTNKQASYIL